MVSNATVAFRKHIFIIYFNKAFSERQQPSAARQSENFHKCSHPNGVNFCRICLKINRALAPYPKSVYVQFEIDCLKNLASIAVRPIRMDGRRTDAGQTAQVMTIPSVP